MLRVDHAGEYGAVNIYRGQRAVFEKLRGKERLSALLEEMEDGEQHHLETFDKLLTERNIRPTLFSPIWNAAGFALGAGTALLGEKAAMACTSAVEDVIEKHYAEQIEELGDEEPEIKATITQFRAEEIEHHDTAIEEGAEEAFGYSVLKGLIGTGCRIAIRLSEKI
ncbi:demethoxyubiquinone hydroxylase family protein [Parvularcula marina]|uniref:3-demethoxyubiquinol 3-hydroxylase n=1 Tax=Parvularcula marina TaxID=2292771 RepID=A0A371RLJ7_9PROT|nr:demethoxyubiquinone hydroxylase family protein [Parvularcula marina]